MTPLFSVARLGAAHLQHAIPAMACGAMVVVASSSSNDQTTGSRTTATNTTRSTFCEASSSSASSSSKVPASRRRLDKNKNDNNNNNIDAAATRTLRKRMTSVGRFSVLSETANNPSVCVLLLVMSGKKPFHPQDFIDLYRKREIDTKHERFRSTLDISKTDGSNHNKNVDDGMTHFVVQQKEFVSKVVKEVMTYPLVYRKELKEWIKDAIVQPLNLSESLWQARTFTGGFLGQSGAVPKPKNPLDDDDDIIESLLLFRAHHCMADGVSLGAIFGDLVDETDEINDLIAKQIRAYKKKKKKTSWWRKFAIMLYYWWWGTIKSVGYHLYLHWMSLIENNDPWKLLKVQHQQQLIDASETTTTIVNPRTISWVQVAEVSQVKKVAEYFSQFSSNGGKVTVNDIFCSCVSGAIAKLIRYHQSRYPDLNLCLPYMNLVMPVHMQGGVLLPGQQMGNKIGALVSRIPAQDAKNSQDRLTRVHDTLLERKQTPAAVLSYLAAMTFGALGGTGNGLLPWLFEKAHAKASAVVTNVRGPEHAVHLDGRRIEASLGFLPLPAGIPIGLCVHSYNQKLSLTVVGESWAVPDADLFLSWVVDEYRSLLEEATRGK